MDAGDRLRASNQGKLAQQARDAGLSQVQAFLRAGLIDARHGGIGGGVVVSFAAGVNGHATARDVR